MKLTEVIDSLIEERGLNREQVSLIVCEGILVAYQKKYPDITFSISLNKRTGDLEVCSEKTAVAAVDNDDTQITVRKAKSLKPTVQLDDILQVPFEGPIGRIEILAAKNIIANRIRELEQLAVCNEFKDKKGSIVTGIAHKKEHAGLVVKIGEVMALLPVDRSMQAEQFRVGFQIKALLKEVLPIARGDYQLILDRSSAEFVKKLIELEIPEVYEGAVEVKKIVRIAGYKTKAVVASTSKEIDPVGTCVGVGGARIKPILRELGQEKIDLIEWTEDFEKLVAQSLKPAEIDNVQITEDNRAIVWLAQDQRSIAIGKMGQNISLAAKLVGVEIQLQDVVGQDTERQSLSSLTDEDINSDFFDHDSSSRGSDDSGSGEV